MHHLVFTLAAGLLGCGAALAQTPKQYVPEPKPPKTDYLVGAHYFPGWKEGTHFVPWPGETQAWGWYKIVPFPNRTPLLGYYDEGSPEVADWEIKWALEHGIDYFVYCWYRQRDNVGKPISVDTLRLGHAIHEGFFRARYRDRFRFAIMWENNNGGGVTSADELIDTLAPFWIEQYFKHPSYLKIGNRPVLYIYSLKRLLEDLGAPDKVNAALTRLRQAVRKAGFDGLVLMGAPNDTNPKVLQTVRDCGFDSLFAYGWEPREQHPTTAQSIGRQVAVAEAWRDAHILPFVLTATVGRDRAPWSRDHPSTPYLHPDRLKRWTLSPEQYGELLTSLKSVMDAQPATSPVRRMILLDAWNEWGEGHHLAPHTGAGFGYLKAVREVFTSQDNQPDYRSPYELGLGPYDSRHKARWAK